MKEQLAVTLANSRNYTLAVAELMPEKEYDFKPVDTVWSFGELVHHIAYGILWWRDNFIKGKKVNWEQPPAKANKKDIIAYLNAAYASLDDIINNGNLSGEAVNGFHATLDHITHHRGQLVLFLRCKAIVPPDYVY